MDSADVARYRANYQDELDSVAVYLALADSDPSHADLYRDLAQDEQRHAAFWKERLERAGYKVDHARPSARARILAWTARRLGPRYVLPAVALDESRNEGMYDHQPEAVGTSLPDDERLHAATLRALQSGGDIARAEGRHRMAVGGNALRAAVLGANDGLVSNLALVMGVAGAVANDALTADAVVVSGFAGLLAGASSMAIGEWISVQSAREAAERQLQIEADEIMAMPEEEERELRLLYERKGLPPEHAAELAKVLMRDPDVALDTLAREELGISPDELGGSPWTAATTSFVLFAVGAIIPVVPFLFTSGLPAVAYSVAVSGLGLFALGAAITLFTGRNVRIAGGRQLLIGLATAALTYGVGALLGVTVAG